MEFLIYIKTFNEIDIMIAILYIRKLEDKSLRFLPVSPWS